MTTLSPIVLILFCQVSHPLFKNPGSATDRGGGGGAGDTKWNGPLSLSSKKVT